MIHVVEKICCRISDSEKKYCPNVTLENVSPDKEKILVREGHKAKAICADEKHKGSVELENWKGGKVGIE